MSQKFIPLAQKDVAAAGTAVQITTISRPYPTIVIQADPDNAGNIFLTDSTVDSDNGYVLAPGAAITFTGDEMRGKTDEYIPSDFYIDCEAGNTDGVRMLVVAQRN